MIYSYGKIFMIYENFIFSQRVVGYYPQWVMSSFPPNEIDFNIVTHVIVTFQIFDRRK